MKSEFVPYELALRMKALDYNEECLAYYNLQLQIEFKSCYNKVPIIMSGKKCGIPTFSQAFRWFREKYGLHHVIHQFNFKKDTDEEYLAEVNQTDDGFMYFRTYEECECFCLTKLIEIVENEKML